MKYAARLSRMEKLAGKGACPSCRLFRRHALRDPGRPRLGPKDPSLLVTSSCDNCGASWRADLSGLPAGVIEVLRLYYTASAEDAFTDPRVWAAKLWPHYLRSALRQRREVLRQMRVLSRPALSTYERDRLNFTRCQRARERELARAKDPDAKLYCELLAESQALAARRRRRLERRYGSRPFPELHDLLANLRGPDYGPQYKGEPYEHDVPSWLVYDISQEAKSWAACAELEKVVLGEVSAYTAGKLARCERRAQKVTAAGRAKYEEREERRRRDEAERQRQRLERPAAPHFSQPAPRPPTPQPEPSQPEPYHSEYKRVIAQMRAAGVWWTDSSE